VTRSSLATVVAAGIFLVLAAAVLAIAPLPLAVRSAGIVLAFYLAFAVAGTPWAYVAALLAPPVGLIGGDEAWLVMLPLILSGNLLALLALEVGWRLSALLVSPVALLAPHVVVWALSLRELFRLDLPWEPSALVWLALHAVASLVGVVVAVTARREPA